VALHCDSMSTTKGSVPDHAFPYSDHEALTAELRLEPVSQDGPSGDGRTAGTFLTLAVGLRAYLFGGGVGPARFRLKADCPFIDRCGNVVVDACHLGVAKE